MVVKPFVRNLLIILNVVGFLIGTIFSYGPQLLATNPLLWIFVPDCPLAGLLFAISLILLAFNKKSNTFFLLSFITGIKYSIWTWFTTLSYWGFYVTPFNLDFHVINLGTHLVLFLEQFILLKHVKISFKGLSFVLAFLLIHDLSDYLLNTHPYLPEYAVTSMFSFTVILTLFSTAVVYLLIKKRKQFSNLKLKQLT